MPLPFWIGFFGVCGVMLRYAMEAWLGPSSTASFPTSTFLINGIGSFAIGLIYVLGTERLVLPKDMQVAISMGLLGGFTTFSAFSLQSLLLFQQRQWLLAFVYWVGSPMVGLICALAGLSLGRLVGK